MHAFIVSFPWHADSALKGGKGSRDIGVSSWYVLPVHHLSMTACGLVDSNLCKINGHEIAELAKTKNWHQCPQTLSSHVWCMGSGNETIQCHFKCMGMHAYTRICIMNAYFAHDTFLYVQGRNPLYTSCQKDYKNVAYKSEFASDNQWRPAPSKIGNEVNFDDSSLVIANLYSKTSTESAL